MMPPAFRVGGSFYKSKSMELTDNTPFPVKGKFLGHKMDDVPPRYLLFLHNKWKYKRKSTLTTEEQAVYRYVDVNYQVLIKDVD